MEEWREKQSNESQMAENGGNSRQFLQLCSCVFLKLNFYSLYNKEQLNATKQTNKKNQEKIKKKQTILGIEHNSTPTLSLYSFKPLYLARKDRKPPEWS